MTSPRPLRYALFALIYFAEGAIVSYFAALNTIYLRGFQLTMTSIGLIGTIAMIPFVLKIFLGMLSDRFNFFGLGYRKPYMIIGLLTQAACLFVVPFIDPANQFGLFAALAFVLMTGQALYDTCTDGLALDTTAPEEQGVVQGLMVAGRALGVVLISAVIGLLAKTSWAWVFYSLAALTLIPLPFVLAVRENPRPAGRKFEWKAFRAFSRADILFLGLLGALYSLVINGANELVSPFLQKSFSVPVDALGFYTSVWGIGVILGGLTGGRLTDRLGQRRAVVVAMGITSLAVPALAVIPGPHGAWPLVALFGVAYGYYETVYFAVSMQRSDPRIAASMFSILMAVANLGTAVGLGLSGALSDWIGFPLTFVVLAFINLLALPMLPVIYRSAPSSGVVAENEPAA